MAILLSKDVILKRARSDSPKIVFDTIYRNVKPSSNGVMFKHLVQMVELYVSGEWIYGYMDDEYTRKTR